MRRYLPLCLLVTLFPLFTGCGESPNRPSVVTDTPVNPPKTSARFIQAPWDISLFFNLPGGAVVVDARTAATNGAAAPGDNLTGTFVNSNGFAGTLTGVLTGNLEGGNFDGTLSTITPSGCTAERRFIGPITTQALNWSPGTQVNDCGGTSPLTSGIQAAAAPPTAPPPCTYAVTATGTSVPAAGGTGTVSVTAGTGCNWFATSSAGFVTLSASQGTATGSVQFTVAANSSTTQRTAIVVVAGQSFTITQAGVPAPLCNYALNGASRTFDASGGIGGVDMRVAPGCAWQAQSDAPWLTITSGAGGSGDGAINFAVAPNPELSQRVGRITAQGLLFTVTQNGISCVYSVTPPTTTAFSAEGGSGSASVSTQAVCAWTATASVPWITVTPPAGGTGNGAASFTVAANTEPVARNGAVTVAGREIAITQAAAPCVFTLTPSTTSIPFSGGSATIGVATHAACAWTAAVDSNAQWITIAGGGSGPGPGTVSLRFAANTTAQQRTGAVTVGTSSVTFTQAATTLGTLSGTVRNSVNEQVVADATVTLTPVPQGPALTTTTNAAGVYTFSNVQQGIYNVLIQKAGFDDARNQSPITITAAQTTTFDVTLVPRPVNLVITWTPNPTSVNPSNVTCGLPNVAFCWQSALSLQETSGNTAPVTALTLHFFDVAGAPTFSVAGSGTPFTIQGGATIQNTGTATLQTAAGGGVEFEFAGTDAFGRTFSIRSPRLGLNPFIVIGLNATEGQPAGTAGMPQGSVQPAPARTIRRRQ
jgi:carboxypeptidase family protein/BACON domain-containing protein/all-beta uncharacterized protein